MNRRDFAKQVFAFASFLALPRALKAQSQLAPFFDERAAGNFHAIYDSVDLRSRFKLFLKNVFNVLPEDQFDELIAKITAVKISDRDIYQEILKEIPEIKPFLADLRFGLRALFKQKKEMARQTAGLLEKGKTYDGYLEVGSPGTYVSTLNDTIEIEGKYYLCNSYEPSYSMVDMLHREQISALGTYVPLGDYESFVSKGIPKDSLSLVTVYIGFHHCPLPRRDEFFTSLRDVLKPGGVMIVRDHDVTNKDMEHMVGLAHDVFNAGSGFPLATNESELRHFYSLAFLTEQLSKHGFKDSGARILQDGDPTLNTLMRFEKH